MYIRTHKYTLIRHTNVHTYVCACIYFVLFISSRTYIYKYNIHKFIIIFQGYTHCRIFTINTDRKCH